MPENLSPRIARFGPATCTVRNWAALATWLGPSLVLAQGTGSSRPSTGPLPAPRATHAAEFTSISAVRELSDGRVLVIDEGEKRLVAVRWGSPAPTLIGREGSGVGEYRDPRTLFAFSGDTTLMPDPRNRRWLLLAGDSIVSMLASDSPAIRAGGASPLGADARTSVITQVPRMVNGLPKLDSLLLLRIGRSAPRVDTVGALRARVPSIPGGGRIDPTKPVAITFNPLSVGEQAAHFGDGWIAIARLAPYRVDWISPAGAVTVGISLDHEAVRVDDREKLGVLAREAGRTGREPRSPDAVGDWPETMPPFLAAAILPAPDGNLWIRRAPSTAHTETRYDVVDRKGAVVRRVVLEATERVVGFGRGSVFTVKVDTDGFERLRVHADEPARGRRI